MRRFLRFLLRALAGITLLLGAAVAVLALLLRRETPCPPGALATTDALAADAAPDASSMLAIRQHCYGPPEVLQLERVSRPVPSARQLLVRVRAASVNPLDWHYQRGRPYVMRLESGLGTPKEAAFGADFAGVVEAVGDSVTRFAPGDSVFGSRTGAFGQYVTIGETAGVARMPSGVSFEEASTLGVAATTALQALRDHAHVQPGERVLINGASGGVGTFAVQLAKSMGAHVTGVASTRNQELMRSLGADATLDYTQVDFTQAGARYHVIIDLVGNHAPSALRRVLERDGRAVLVGGPELDPYLGPVRPMVAFTVYDWFVPEAFGGMLATTTQPDLTALAALMARGALRVVIDRRFTLAEVPAAVAYQEQGRSRGKNVVLMP